MEGGLNTLNNAGFKEDESGEEKGGGWVRGGRASTDSRKHLWRGAHPLFRVEEVQEGGGFRPSLR